MNEGFRTPDDLEARALLEHWRTMGEIIDDNTVRRVAEALRVHELRYHPSASAANDERERIPDQTIRAIIAEVRQEHCTYAEAARHHSVEYARFVIDLADFETRMRDRLLQQTDEAIDALLWEAFEAEGEVAS